MASPILNWSEISLRDKALIYHQQIFGKLWIIYGGWFCNKTGTVVVKNINREVVRYCIKQAPLTKINAIQAKEYIFRCFIPNPP